MSDDGSSTEAFEFESSGCIPICQHCSHEFHYTALPVENLGDAAYVSSEMELAQVRSDLEAEERELQRFDLELSKVELTSKRLSAGRACLVQRMNKRRAALSLMRKMPMELWQMIFSWVCLSEEFSLDFSDTRTVQTTTNVLASVCRLWRRITHSTPALWCSIRVDLQDLVTDFRPLIKLSLRNSSGRPLRISITDFSDSSFSCNGFTDDRPRHSTLAQLQDDTFHFLLSNLSRCRELHLQMNHLPLRQPLLDLSSLESFFTNVVPDVYEALFYSTGWLWESISNAPHLTDLSVYRLPPSSAIPIRHLRHLDVQLVSKVETRKFFEVIPLIANLESLTIRQISIAIWEPWAGVRPMNLTRLRHLSLDTDTKHHPILPRQFLGALTLPSLESFDLKTACVSVEASEDNNFAAIVAFLRRNSRSLKALNVQFRVAQSVFQLDEFSLSDIVAPLPELNHLHLDFDEAWNETITVVMDLLSDLTSQLSLAPCLTELMLSTAYTEEIISDFLPIADRLLGFAESRGKGDTAGREKTNLTAARLFLTNVPKHAAVEENWDPLSSDEKLADRLALLESDSIECVFGLGDHPYPETHQTPGWWWSDLAQRLGS
ncbi:hypothetical protein V5O48_018468 [Marasmius crinis-equi]|uniref:F-box domain-containing protein n=1 Tax=Marasmius crinis-equi TaxID=585013 RepID=A0ABR3EL37_9AGAR